MSVTNVKSKWVGGDLYFYDVSGNEIFHIDGTNRKFVIPTGSALTVNATDLSAAEMAVLDGITAGTVAASKALVVDASKDLATIHKLTFSQEVVHASAVTQTKSANYTLAEADSGKITYVDTDAVVLTLPPTVVGMTFTIVNAGADGAVGINVSPDAVDKIMGNGFTATDNKDAINTKATAKKGDLITLVGDGVNGWFVQRVHGTWARE